MRVQPSEQARMLELYRQPGSTLRTVAAALGRSPTTVRRHLEAQGVVRRPARRRRPPSFPTGTADQIVKRYDHGESLAALGQAFRTSSKRIRRLLEYRNVPIRPRGRPPRSDGTSRQWPPVGTALGRPPAATQPLSTDRNRRTAAPAA